MQSTFDNINNGCSHIKLRTPLGCMHISAKMIQHNHIKCSNTIALLKFIDPERCSHQINCGVWMGLVGEYRRGYGRNGMENITETMHKSILQQRIQNPRKEQDHSEDN